MLRLPVWMRASRGCSGVLLIALPLTVLVD